METLNLSKENIIELFNNGTTVKKCCGLWNNPRTNNTIVRSTNDIETFYKWASMVEVKQYDGDTSIYLHGYSSGDMF